MTICFFIEDSFCFQRSKQTSRLGRLQHTVHRRSHSSAFSKPTRGLLVDLFKPSQHNGSYCNLVSGTCHPAPASKHKIQKKHEHLLSTPHLIQLQHRHLQFHLVNPICSKSGLYCAICAKVLLSNTLLCVITSALIQYHVYQVIKTTLLQTSVFCGFLCNSLTLKACSISLPCSRQVLLWSAHVLYCSDYFDPFCALMSDMGKSIQK